MVSIKRVIYFLLFLIAVILGILVGLLLVYQRSLVKISELEDYSPSIMSIVYDCNGNIIGEFAIEKRIPINYSDIPPHLRYAIITAEDRSFEKHWGIDLWGILRALKNKLIFGMGERGGKHNYPSN
jgi:Membrane carboxypeptidase/penicillin-binding protein